MRLYGNKYNLDPNKTNNRDGYSMTTSGKTDCPKYYNLYSIDQAVQTQNCLQNHGGVIMTHQNKHYILFLTISSIIFLIGIFCYLGRMFSAFWA